MTGKIPVRLVSIDGRTEVSMDFNDFQSSGTGIGEDVTSLKNTYVELIRDVRPVLGRSARPSTTERWQACRRLADFIDGHARFDITNFSAACARDMGLKSFRHMVSFGREFESDEVLDSIPYTTYRVLILNMAKLKQRGMFKSEKARLNRTKERLDYKRYTEYLGRLKD